MDKMDKYKKAAIELLGSAGIAINGDRPWDIKVHDERFYKRSISEGTLGFGESYMDGWWDADRLDETITRAIAAGLKQKVLKNPHYFRLAAQATLTNMASKKRAFKIGEEHYDNGNDLYEAMLDKLMTYTCGYWKDAKNLDEAQEAKLDLACRKIGLKKGDKVLDIGGGWGSFARFAAEKYSAETTVVTVSKEQVALGKEKCAGLPVEFRLQDYRDVGGEKFDHVVSFGMFEHVGYKNYRTFMEVARSVLKDNGFLFLHTIGSNHTGHTTDPWIEKYIFPNSMLPSIKQIGGAIERLFVMEDWHNFGADYDKTLMAWFKNFDTAWPALQENYSERFYRMWKFYLLSCAGAFRSRHIQLWQIVLSKNGVPGGYTSIR